MGRITLRGYWSENRYGDPILRDCSAFDEIDLVKMLGAPAHLPAVSWRIGYEIWGRRVNLLFNQKDGGIKAAQFGNLGFARGLAELGFRVVPEPDEIVFLDADENYRELVRVLLALIPKR